LLRRLVDTKIRQEVNREKQEKRLIEERNREKKAKLLGDLKVFPEELLPTILSYIPFPDILNFRGVNHLFYQLITDYIQVGLVGIANKPTVFFHTPSWVNDKTIDFRKSKLSNLSPYTIPSFFFYRLLGNVKDLPQDFWPYIQGTQIHILHVGSK